MPSLSGVERSGVRRMVFGRCRARASARHLTESLLISHFCRRQCQCPSAADGESWSLVFIRGAAKRRDRSLRPIAVRAPQLLPSKRAFRKKPIYRPSGLSPFGAPLAARPGQLSPTWGRLFPSARALDSSSSSEDVILSGPLGVRSPPPPTLRAATNIPLVPGHQHPAGHRL